MARQFRRAAIAVPGESLRGLVFDACFENRMPHTFGLLRHYGMPNRNSVLVSESLHLNTAGLATALRIDEAEVLLRRYPAYLASHRSFHGVYVPKARIEDETRRFSPAAIQGGILHHPATHELRDLPFSTVGWDMLRDRCPCVGVGIRQGWITTNGCSRCQSCGGSLGNIDPIPVAEGLRPSLALAAGLVDPDAHTRQVAIDLLPDAIRNTDRTLIYDMIFNLARVATSDIDATNLVVLTEAIAGACTAILEWPQGLAEIRRSKDCPDYRWGWVNRHYAILDIVARTDVAPSANGPTTSPAMATTYVPSGSGGRIHSRVINISSAVRLGHVDAAALREAWENGRFTQYVCLQKGVRSKAFDPTEVVSIAPHLRVVTARGSAATILGIPSYGVEQLLERSLLSPDAPRKGVTQRAAHDAAAQNLIARFTGEKAVDIAEPVVLAEAMRHVSGRPKPWGTAIEALLDGDIRWGIDDARRNHPLVERLVVPASAIPGLIVLQERPAIVDIQRADVWPQEDALECLNGNRSVPATLKGLDFSGTSRKLYSVAAILARAAVGVTTADLARRSDRSSMRMAIILADAAVPQVAPGLWERQRAENVAFTASGPRNGGHRGTEE